MTDDLVRSRLALVLASPAIDADTVRRALGGGDVATVFLAAAGRSAAEFQASAEVIVPLVQEAGSAAIVVDDTRCAGRVGADGIHISGGSLPDLQEAIERFAPKLIVGGSGFKTRHAALEAGEAMPDYLFFGRLSASPGAAPAPDDLELAQWWAPVVEIPCVLMGGGDLATLRDAAATRAEFVALSSAILDHPASAGDRVREANRILDEMHDARRAA